MMKGIIAVNAGDKVSIRRDNDGVIKAVIVTTSDDFTPPIVECVRCKKLTPTIVCTPVCDVLDNVSYTCYECD